MNPNYAVPTLALLLGVLIGLGGVAVGGYWVHDASNPAYSSMPECPAGFQPDKPLGVVYIAGTWEPIYGCEYANGAPEEGIDAASMTPGTSPSLTSSAPSPSPQGNVTHP